MTQLNPLRVGQFHGEKTDLTGGMQARVPGTRHKYHHLMYKKILDGYDNFNTYVVIGCFRATTDFGCPGIQCHVMTLEDSIVVSKISHNNKSITVLSTLFVLHLSKPYEQLLSRIKKLQ